MNLIHWHRNDSSEAENLRARRAFETVLIVAAKEPDTERYRNFSAQVNERRKALNVTEPMGKLVSDLFLVLIFI